jgi:ABC-2 type transport system ATP-binding protein
MKVSIRNLTKTYGTQRAIDDLSFEVGTGEIVGFLGPNGAGKTTTMKIVTCFMPPTSGTVHLDNFNIFDHPLEIRRRVGYLPENNPLYLDMYVREFLDFAGKIYQLDNGLRKKRIPQIIEMTGLGREQHKKIGMLSKGYRQRVGLCQALIHDPEVLILDEPTSGLDPNQIVEIRNLIREVGKDKTVIFSSHILPEVEAIADRVIIIDRGKIVADQPVSNLAAIGANEAIVDVEFESPGFDFSDLLALDSVLEVIPESETFFRIRTSAEGEDIRKRLFQQAAAGDHVILMMQKETYSLEDAFRRLTGG